MPRSFALGDRFEAFIDDQVRGDGYDNASEVVREALSLLEDREALRDINIVDLRRLAEEGRVSGLSDEDGEAVLAPLEAKYRAMTLPAA